MGHAGKEFMVHENVECYAGDGQWVPARNGQIPEGAVPAGYESNGTMLYAARAFVDGCLTPGKISATSGGALVPHGGKEHRVLEYEVLVERRAK
jgi:hypothetical protein